MATATEESGRGVQGALGHVNCSELQRKNWYNFRLVIFDHRLSCSCCFVVVVAVIDCILLIVTAQPRPQLPRCPCHAFDNFLHNCRGNRLSSFVVRRSLSSFLGAIHKLRRTTHKYYRYRAVRISQSIAQHKVLAIQSHEAEAEAEAGKLPRCCSLI